MYESWHFHYQTSVSLRPILARVTGPNKNNDELFFVITRALYTLRFIKKGQTVNWHSYLEILGTILEALRQERHRLWPDACILHQDNVPANDMLSVWEFWAKTFMTKLDHPLYSLDLQTTTYR
jgi:hypothetical protein